jgi:hypothetical protein
MLEWLKTEPYLIWVTTGDESWSFEYDPETKRESEEWHTLVSKKKESSQGQIKKWSNFFILMEWFIKNLYHLVSQ